MATPEQAQTNKWPDENLPQPAGEESRRPAHVDDTQSGQLSEVSMPRVPRYLDESGEVPARPFGDWKGTWIEDA
jgi:hypothetical protein